jgi:bifunctional non-homologous end joining protein LigD
MVFPSGFSEPCLPSKVAPPPSGPLWVQEIKHDGYRLMVRRDGSRVRCFTRNGHDWADRFPAIVEAAARLKAQSFLIDGEAVIARDDGTPDFHALRSKRRGHEAVLFAFDLIERKRRLKKLLGRAKGRAIQFVEHVTGDGPTVLEHVCRMGVEGVVSKRTDASKTWLKTKNPDSAAVRRESEENWRSAMRSSSAGNAMFADEGVPKVARRFEHLFGGHFLAVVYKVDHPAAFVRNNDLNRGIGFVVNALVL